MDRTKNLGRADVPLERKVFHRARHKLRPALAPAQFRRIELLAHIPAIFENRAPGKRLHRREVDGLPSIQSFARKDEIRGKVKRLEANGVQVYKPSSMFEQQLVAKEIGEAGIGLMLAIGKNARGRKDLVAVERRGSRRNPFRFLVDIEMKRVSMAQKGRDAHSLHGGKPGTHP